ncbi:MAG TPA: class I SAM-dependent methyltransferase [Thermoanaerobaculia bacterium]|nr:class I SAM-dependent methyltransferase [Thermoanaerobaculia bacterium]
MRRLFQRFLNAQWKVRSGVSLFGENVTPAVPNDLFQAHASIYSFFSGYVEGKRVLELGCGTGYGAPMLLRGGAQHITAIDAHAGNVRFARKRSGSPRLQYMVGDAEALPQDFGTFDVIVSSNVFEHLSNVDRALAQVLLHLSPDGKFLLAVPPITDPPGMEANLRNPYHVSNYYVHEWLERLSARFDRVSLLAHLPPPGAQLDFGNPFPSAIEPASFAFVERSLASFAGADVLTAVFVCQGARRSA